MVLSTEDCFKIHPYERYSTDPMEITLLQHYLPLFLLYLKVPNFHSRNDQITFCVLRIIYFHFLQIGLTGSTRQGACLIKELVVAVVFFGPEIVHQMTQDTQMTKKNAKRSILARKRLTQLTVSLIATVCLQFVC